MAQSTVVVRRSSPRILHRMSLVPWTLLIILFLVITTLDNVDMRGSVVGYIFLVFGLFVLAVEFFKSGDISSAAFLTDLVIAVISIIAATALLTVMLMDERYQLTFFHWYGAAILVADAILSPFNSFRTAKRNIEVGALSPE